MAIELSRTFNIAEGSVHLEVRDALGTTSIHTIYVTGPHGVASVDAAVAQILADTDAACAVIQAKFAAAGWTPGV